jgi:hypothetical protein
MGPDLTWDVDCSGLQLSTERDLVEYLHNCVCTPHYVEKMPSSASAGIGGAGAVWQQLPIAQKLRRCRHK